MYHTYTKKEDFVSVNLIHQNKDGHNEDYQQ